MPAHIHAELMKQYAEDAMTTDKPWELWEFACQVGPIQWKGFFDEHPAWDEKILYRRKPRTININGHEVPEPMRVAPKARERFWVPNLWNSEDPHQYLGQGTGDHKELLRGGICHSTQEAAIAHARALLSFTEVKA